MSIIPGDEVGLRPPFTTATGVREDSWHRREVNSSLSASEIVALRNGVSREPLLQGTGRASNEDLRDSSGSDANSGPLWIVDDDVRSVRARMEVVRKSVVTAIESSCAGARLGNSLLLLLWFLLNFANFADTTSRSPFGVPRRRFALGDATPILLLMMKPLPSLRSTLSPNIYKKNHTIFINFVHLHKQYICISSFECIFA